MSKNWVDDDDDMGRPSKLVHEGTDSNPNVAVQFAERRDLITQVIFLTNSTKVGAYACYRAVNLVVVDLPEGITIIGKSSFNQCHALRTVTFPKTLSLIDKWAFSDCRSLEVVDLLHTSILEVKDFAFGHCSELKTVTLPDSLQTFGKTVFFGCILLYPTDKICHDNCAVAAHLRSLQQQLS